jgi:lysozyme
MRKPPAKRVSTAGLEIIKFYEALRLKAYRCPAGIPTIGWGHTRGVKMGDTCTLIQAEDWLREDCAEAENAVNSLVKVPLTHNQFDALVSFVFNIGAGAFSRSTLLRLLNSGDYSGASKQFERWNKSGGVVLNGLTARRKREKTLFLTFPANQVNQPGE